MLDEEYGRCLLLSLLRIAASVETEYARLWLCESIGVSLVDLCFIGIITLR